MKREITNTDSQTRPSVTSFQSAFTVFHNCFGSIFKTLHTKMLHNASKLYNNYAVNLSEHQNIVHVHH